MKVNRFWQYRWAVLRWGLIALALYGQAAALYSWLPPVPPVPRWVVRGEYSSLGLSPDGKILRTQTPDSSGSSIHHRRNDCWVHGDDRDAVDWVPLYARYGPVQFWDIADGHLVRRFFDDASSINSVVFSRDGTTMYAVARHGPDTPTVRLHAVDLGTGDESQAQVPTAQFCWNIRLSPRGELLLLERFPDLDQIRDDASRFRPCWRLYDSRSLRLLMTEDNSLSQWQWARDGDALLLYDAGSNGKSSLRRINTQGETVTQFDGAGAWLILTPDGKTLLTAWPAANEEGPGPSVLLWDPATGQRLGEIPRCWPGGPSRGEEVLLADGRTMVITQSDVQGSGIL